MYTWYHNPSSSCSPNILLTKLLHYTKRQIRKREIIQPNIYRILPKVNQVIYTMDTVYMPIIMILAHAVIQIFCWQGSIGLQCVRRKREIIHPNIHRILRKVNQVIYTLDTMCAKYHDPSSSGSPDTLLTMSFMSWMPKSEKANNSVNIHRILRKVTQVIYIM